MSTASKSRQETIARPVGLTDWAASGRNSDAIVSLRIFGGVALILPALLGWVGLLFLTALTWLFFDVGDGLVCTLYLGATFACILMSLFSGGRDGSRWWILAAVGCAVAMAAAGYFVESMVLDPQPYVLGDKVREVPSGMWTFAVYVCGFALAGGLVMPRRNKRPPAHR